MGDECRVVVLNWSSTIAIAAGASHGCALFRVGTGVPGVKHERCLRAVAAQRITECVDVQVDEKV